MAAETNTLADLIAQAVTALRAHGEFILAAAVEQNALANEQLARRAEGMAEIAERATALAEMFRAYSENGETR